MTTGGLAAVVTQTGLSLVGVPVVVVVLVVVVVRGLVLKVALLVVTVTGAEVVDVSRQWGQHCPLRRTGTLQAAGGQRWEKHWTVPLAHRQLVQASVLQVSPDSSTSPSPVTQ